MAQVFWAPATQVGDLEEAPSSMLQPGPAIALVTIWAVNQQTEDRSVSLLSLTLSIQIFLK